MKYTCKNLTETKKVAEDFVTNITPSKNATVVALFGELGAGKTTFTSFIGKYLKLDESIISPTFIIKRRYKINKKDYPFKNFVHIDAYRLKDSTEFVPIGFDEDFKDSKNLIFIEWPENIIDALPEDCIKIRLEHLSPDCRIIDIDGQGKIPKTK